MSTTIIESGVAGDGIEAPRHGPDGSAPDTAPADPVAVAYFATLDAHERLYQAVAASVEADREMTFRERRRWMRLVREWTADIAELRRDSPFDAGASG